MLRQKRKLNYSSKRVEHLHKQRTMRNCLCWVCFILTLACLYFIFFSPAFLLINVGVKNNKEIPSDLLLSVLRQRIMENNNKIYWNFLSLFTKNPNVLANLVLINNSNIASQIKIDFPQINTVNVSKNFFTHTLEVKIEEKRPILVAKISGLELSNMYVDQNGILFKANTVDYANMGSINFFDVPENIMAGLNETIVDKQIFSADQIKNIMLLQNYILEVKKLVINLEYSFNKQNSLVIQTKEGFDVYLPINDKIVDAFKAADIYYQKEIQPKKKAIEYIDARYYPEKLFFK